MANNRHPWTPTDPVIKAAHDDCLLQFIRSAESSFDYVLAYAHDMTPIEQVVMYALHATRQWEPDLYIKPQYKVGKYTADFMVEFGSRGEKPTQYIIECDGHDFHERTKEQAQHDKERDRHMQSLGFKVYRFTGSEIWKSKGYCVVQALLVPAELRG